MRSTSRPGSAGTDGGTPGFRHTAGVPAPFGWDPAGFWVTTITLAATAIVLGVGVPWSMRRYRRLDQAERGRVAAVLRELAGHAGGGFVPAAAVTVHADGEHYRTTDHGWARVPSGGLLVEVGVEPAVDGATAKSIVVRVSRPADHRWSAPPMTSRPVRRHRRGDPTDPAVFTRAFPGSRPDQLTAQARAALLDLLGRSIRICLDTDTLSVWALPAQTRRRADPRITGLTSATQLLPYLHHTTATASLLLGSEGAGAGGAPADGEQRG